MGDFSMSLIFLIVVFTGGILVYVSFRDSQNKALKAQPQPQSTRAPIMFERGKYLISCDNWFTGPDGEDYKSAWGEVEILGDNILGVKTNRNSSNWYAKVGSNEKFVLIAGCQIHYAVRCANKPDIDKLHKGWSSSAADGINIYGVPNCIYIAE